MRRSRISIVAGHLFIAFLAARSTVSADIYCGPTFDKNTDRWPLFLACLGDGNHGNWTSLYKNGSRYLIANFNKTHEEVFNNSYVVTLFTDKSNRTGATLQMRDRWGNRPFDLPGTYVCSMENETCSIEVLTNLWTNGVSTQHHLELQCSPPPTRGRRPLRNNVRYPPYNITWYINGTVVGWSVCNGTCTATYNNSSPYVVHHNVSIYGDRANVTNEDPLCLSCVLTADGSAGITSICTLGTDDPSLWGIPGVGKFGRKQPVIGENPDGGPPNGGNHPGGGPAVFVCSVTIVCAVAGFLVFLTRVRKKRDGPHRIVYRPIVGRPVGTRERDTP